MLAPPELHEADREPVYVWDLVVRVTHWGIALGMLVLVVTGLYLGDPVVSVPGLARDHFVTGWAKIVHFYAAIVFVVSAIARVIWLFLGPRRSSWRNFIPISRRRRHDFVKTLKFYMMVRPRPPVTIGHNPLAGLSYVGVFGLYFLMIATGLALYSVSSYSFMRHFDFLLPLFHGAQGARWLHHATMWVLIMFFVAHVFLSMLTSRAEKTGTIDSIFSGYKNLPKGQPPDDVE